MILASSAALVLAAWGLWALTGACSTVLNGMMIFSGVVISAAIGFTGLIINSNLQDRLRGEAVDEQHAHERRVIAAALLSEVDFFEEFWTGTRDNFARMNQGQYAQFKEHGHTEVLPVQIFEANTAQLGLLGSEAAAMVIDFYILHHDLAAKLANPKNAITTLDHIREMTARIVDARGRAAESLRGVVGG